MIDLEMENQADILNEELESEKPRLGEAYPHEIKLNNTLATQYGYTLSFQIGWPFWKQAQIARWDSFVIDTTTSHLVTATTNCTTFV